MERYHDISASLKPLDLRDELEAANMKGKNLTFLDDYSKEELGHLFKAAELLEPYSKNQIPLLANKLLYTLFFQPSTRTRCSHEVAMHRLGGRVITETDPMGHSAMAKNESLYDGIRVISQYADVLVLRHGDSEQVLSTLERLGFGRLPDHFRRLRACDPSHAGPAGYVHRPARPEEAL